MKPELRFSANTWIWCKSARKNTVSRESCQQLNLPSNTPEYGYKDALKMTSSSQAYLPPAQRAQQPEILAPEYAGTVFMMGAQRQTDERSALGHTYTDAQSACPLASRGEPQNRKKRKWSRGEENKTVLSTSVWFCFLRHKRLVGWDRDTPIALSVSLACYYIPSQQT